MSTKRQQAGQAWRQRLTQVVLFVLAGVLCGGTFGALAEPTGEAVQASRDGMVEDEHAAEFPGRVLSRQKAELHAAVEPVARGAGQSVVMLRLEGANAVYGTVLSQDGLVVTKASETAEAVAAVLPDGRRVSARRVGVDDQEDLALFQLDAVGLTPVRWARQSPAVGSWAVTPGRGGGVRSVGVVSARPVAVERRRLVLGFFAVSEADQGGVLVAEVVEGMGAQLAGLKAGDVIEKVGDQPASHIRDIAVAVGDYREGQSVAVLVRRAGERLTFEVELRRHRPSPMSRTSRMNRMGTDVSRRSDGFTEVFQHDSVLQPWECGGPVVNLQGEAVGLNIARAGRIASYALPAWLVRERVTDMLAPQGEAMILHHEPDAAVEADNVQP